MHVCPVISFTCIPVLWDSTMLQTYMPLLLTCQYSLLRSFHIIPYKFCAPESYIVLANMMLFFFLRVPFFACFFLSAQVHNFSASFLFLAEVKVFQACSVLSFSQDSACHIVPFPAVVLTWTTQRLAWAEGTFKQYCCGRISAPGFTRMSSDAYQLLRSLHYPEQPAFAQHF